MRSYSPGEFRTTGQLMESGAVVRMDGPMLVFGGPYSNLEATTAVLAEARRLGIPPQRTICTGDIVAYAADPQATLDAIRESRVLAIMGNCEESLSSNAADCGCGFADGSTCDRLAGEWYTYADRHLDRDSRAWMAGLPTRLDVAIAGRRLAVVHGGVRQISRFVFASTPSAAKREEIDAAHCDGVIAGHCGIPFTQFVDGRLWHNSGAIGMPANDGTARTWFSILTPEPHGVVIEHHALFYDHHAAAAKMRAEGLPEEYAAALDSGLWPSCEVLPPAELAERSRPIGPGRLTWRSSAALNLRESWPARTSFAQPRYLDSAKFKDPGITARGERRASVSLKALKTLWFNTGTLCNIACEHCYIESSPRNDRLSYLTLAEVRTYLDEIERDRLSTGEIGFTGGEPFMNPDILAMMEECLSRGFRVLMLTNAMRPMQRLKAPLLDLNMRFGARLTMRVSLDHYTRALHEQERGEETWEPTLSGLKWLVDNKFSVAVAGRTLWGEPDLAMRQGFAQLFAEQGIDVDTGSREKLVIFPEMDADADVPEITEACWDILNVAPESPMCATSRMVVKRKEGNGPSVVACTLLPYDMAFDLGSTLAGASGRVALNHPHCAKFCVLGGGSCSVG